MEASKILSRAYEDKENVAGKLSSVLLHDLNFWLRLGGCPDFRLVSPCPLFMKGKQEFKKVAQV